VAYLPSDDQWRQTLSRLMKVIDGGEVGLTAAAGDQHRATRLIGSEKVYMTGGGQKWFTRHVPPNCMSPKEISCVQRTRLDCVCLQQKTRHTQRAPRGRRSFVLPRPLSIVIPSLATTVTSAQHQRRTLLLPGLSTTVHCPAHARTSLCLCDCRNLRIWTISCTLNFSHHHRLALF
jgi:hypothetical protein